LQLVTNQPTHRPEGNGLRERLTADLTTAIKRRDRPTVSVIRTLLGAIANNEAVPVADPRYDPTVGLGHDVPRRVLDESDLVAILDDEIERHRTGAAAAERAGRAERAEHLRAELEVLVRYRTEV
jgi:uncharacterized protein